MLRANFLNKFEFEDLRNLITSHNFPYFIQLGAANDNDPAMLLTHMVVSNNKEIHSSFYQKIATPIINGIKRFDPSYFAILRLKINCYPRTYKPEYSGWHIDIQEKNHKTIVLNLNNNNGYTDFKNKDLVYNYSKENTAVIFDGKEEHRSVTQTDTNWRYNININYE